MQKFDEILKEMLPDYMKAIEGLKHPASGVKFSEIFPFWALCQLTNVELIVESGVMNGLSTEIMASLGIPMVCVDWGWPGDCYKKTQERLAHHKHITFLTGEGFNVLMRVVPALSDRRIAVMIDGPKHFGAAFLASSLSRYAHLFFLHDAQWGHARGTYMDLASVIKAEFAMFTDDEIYKSIADQFDDPGTGTVAMIAATRMKPELPESFDEWKARNLEWWKEFAPFEANRGDFYQRFIERIGVPDVAELTVGEIAPGGCGGILNHLQPKKRVFIDIIMSDLKALNLVEWKDGEYIDAPFEELPLEDQSLDVMIGHNTLDHGTDWRKALQEIARVSKSFYINFECKGYTDNDHHQAIKAEDVEAFCKTITSHKVQVRRVMNPKAVLAVDIRGEQG